MKKITFLALCLFILGSTAFAYDLAVGAGGVYGYMDDVFHYKSSRDEMSFHRNQFGGFAFFGTKYTEFNFTVRMSKNEWEYWEYDTDETEFGGEDLLVLSVGGYAKYPFSLGTQIIVFPTIGADFDAVEGNLYLWFRAGLGLDLFFTERFFLRGQALYGYGLIFIEPENKTITPGHCPLFKVGFGWMF
jgi:hypothetical protein